MKSTDQRKLIMVILDGWGVAPAGPGNAVAQAYKPNFDQAWRDCAHTTVKASGEASGLPAGQVGNSEAGHMNLGAGRVEKQDLVNINRAIADGRFFENKVLQKSVKHVKARQSRLHLMGLLGYGGVHSWPTHIYALLELAQRAKLDQVYIHLFTDGQDTPGRSAVKFLDELENKIKEIGIGQIVSVSGRFFAMDRVENWSRSAKVYQTIVQGRDPVFPSAVKAVQAAYDRGLSDSFIEPAIIAKKPGEAVKVGEHDALIFFNLRSDRARQLTKAFVEPSFSGFPRGGFIKDLLFIALSDFGKDLPVETAFDTIPTKNALNQVLDEKNLKQLYVAETEKYPHVTYFFHGSSAERRPGEDWVNVPSIETRSYKKYPEMKAEAVADVVIRGMEQEHYGFTLINFANPDMVGHTGDLKAAVKAVEIVDYQLGRILNLARKKKSTVLICADHGNADEMLYPGTGGVSTAHSANPVPVVAAAFGRKIKNLQSGGVLGHLTATALSLLEIEPPREMDLPSLM